VDIADLHIEHLYQRTEINTTAVNDIACNLNLSLVELHVSKRADGRFYVIDGQHRLLAIRLRNSFEVPDEDPIKRIEVKLYVGLTHEEEAELYKELNQTRTALKPFARFKMECVRGNPQALALLTLLQATCISLQPGRVDASEPVPDGFSILKCIEKVRILYADKKLDDNEFLRVLHQCQQLVGPGKEIIRELLEAIYGLAAATHGNSLTDFWTDVMFQIGAQEVQRVAMMAAASRSASVRSRNIRYLAEGLCDRLNHGRRTNFLTFDATVFNR
jgi:hypothetical protein